MAQLVKLEPGDILVLANVGEEQADALRESWESVREAIGVEHVLIFEGDVDLSKVPGDEGKVAEFARMYLNGRITAREAAQILSDDSGDGGE